MSTREVIPIARSSGANRSQLSAPGTSQPSFNGSPPQEGMHCAGAWRGWDRQGRLSLRSSRDGNRRGGFVGRLRLRFLRLGPRALERHKRARLWGSCSKPSISGTDALAQIRIRRATLIPARLWKKRRRWQVGCPSCNASRHLLLRAEAAWAGGRSRRCCPGDPALVRTDSTEARPANEWRARRVAVPVNSLDETANTARGTVRRGDFRSMAVRRRCMEGAGMPIRTCNKSWRCMEARTEKRQALTVFESLGASPASRRFANSFGPTYQGVPRGARATTQSNQYGLTKTPKRKFYRCCRGECAMRRLPEPYLFPTKQWTTMYRRFWASWACPPRGEAVVVRPKMAKWRPWTQSQSLIPRQANLAARPDARYSGTVR